MIHLIDTPAPFEMQPLLDMLARATGPTLLAAQREAVGLHNVLYEERKAAGDQSFDPDKTGESQLKALIPSFCTVERIDQSASDALVRMLMESDAVNKETDIERYRRTRLAPHNGGQHDKETYVLYFQGTPVMAVNTALIPVEARGADGYPDDRVLQGAIQRVLADDAKPIPAEGDRCMVFYGVTNFRHELMRGVPLADALFEQIAEAVLGNEANTVVPQIDNLRYFTTLSPVPGFTKWLEGQGEDRLLKEEKENIHHAAKVLGIESGDAIQELRQIMIHPVVTASLSADTRSAEKRTRIEMMGLLGDLGLEYLLTEPHEDQQRDPAAFHWRKGAYLGGVRVSDGRLLANHVYEAMKPEVRQEREEKFRKQDTITVASYLLERFEARLQARENGAFTQRYLQEKLERGAAERSA